MGLLIGHTYSGGDSRGAFKRGTQIADQDLTVDLPAGMDVCDIGTFTVWCETARVFFSTLVVSRDVFVSVAHPHFYRKF